MQASQQISQSGDANNERVLCVASIAQILIERVIIAPEDLRMIFDLYCQKMDLSEDFEDIMANVNSVLSPLGLKCEDVNDQLSGERVRIIRNTRSYAGSTLYSASIVPFSFDANTLRTLKAFESIYFGRTSCIGVSKQELYSKQMTHEESSNCVDQLVESGWLAGSEGPTLMLYYPTARLYGELQASLEREYGNNTLLECSACNRFAWYAATCTECTRNSCCTSRLHISCYDAFYQRYSELPRGTCPNSECTGSIPEPVRVNSLA